MPLGAHSCVPRFATTDVPSTIWQVCPPHPTPGLCDTQGGWMHRTAGVTDGTAGVTHGTAGVMDRMAGVMDRMARVTDRRLG